MYNAKYKPQAIKGVLSRSIKLGWDGKAQAQAFHQSRNAIIVPVCSSADSQVSNSNTSRNMHAILMRRNSR